VSGCIKGVRKLISVKQPMSVYVHCSNHALDLALQETAREVPIIRDALQTVRDMANIVRESSKRQKLFESLAGVAAEATGDGSKPTRLQTLCPTRWAVRCKAIDALRKSYKPTRDTFASLAQDRSVRPDSRSKIEGLHRALLSVDTYLGLLICSAIFGPCEELAISLQSKTMSLSAAVNAAKVLQRTLTSMRSDEKFTAIYADAQRIKEQLGLDESVSHRRRKPLVRYELIASTEVPYNFPSHLDMVRKAYFEAIDMLHATIEARFSHPRLQQLLAAEKLLLSSVTGDVDEESLEMLMEVYGSDFHSKGARLKAQLTMLPQLIALHSGGYRAGLGGPCPPYKPMSGRRKIVATAHHMSHFKAKMHQIRFRLGLVVF